MITTHFLRKKFFEHAQTNVWLKKPKGADNGVLASPKQNYELVYLGLGVAMDNPWHNTKKEHGSYVQIDKKITVLDVKEEIHGGDLIHFGGTKIIGKPNEVGGGKTFRVVNVRKREPKKGIVFFTFEVEELINNG